METSKIFNLPPTGGHLGCSLLFVALIANRALLPASLLRPCPSTQSLVISCHPGAGLLTSAAAAASCRFGPLLPAHWPCLETPSCYWVCSCQLRVTSKHREEAPASPFTPLIKILSDIKANDRSLRNSRCPFICHWGGDTGTSLTSIFLTLPGPSPDFQPG